MEKQVTVSAKIDEALRRRMEELGIRPSDVIRRALETEVQERTRRNLLAKAAKASGISKKVSKEDWIRSVRESRDES